MKQKGKVNFCEIGHPVPKERIVIKCSLNNRPISEDDARKIIVRAAIERVVKKQTGGRKKDCKKMDSA